MENFDGAVGRITAAVIRSGLQPNTLLQLVVSRYLPLTRAPFSYKF